MLRRNSVFIVALAIAGCSSEPDRGPESEKAPVDTSWREHFWQEQDQAHPGWSGKAWEKIRAREQGELTREQLDVLLAGWESATIEEARADVKNRPLRRAAREAKELRESEAAYQALIKDAVRKNSFKFGTPEESKYWDEQVKNWPGGIPKAEERALREGYIWKGMEEGYAYMQLDRWYPGIGHSETNHPGYLVFVMQGSFDSFTIDREKHQLVTWSFRQ